MLQLRESQDERQLLGGNYRVLQDWESQDKRRLVLMIPDEDNVDIKIKKTSSRYLLLSYNFVMTFNL